MTNSDSSISQVKRVYKKFPMVLGNVTVDAFIHLEDDILLYGVSSVTSAIGKSKISFTDWLNGKSPEAKMYEGLVASAIYHETHHSPVNTIPPEVARAYWNYWSNKGNSKAYALNMASALDSDRRCADEYWGIKRDKAEYAQEKADNIQRIEELHKRALALIPDVLNYKSECLSSSEPADYLYQANKEFDKVVEELPFAMALEINAMIPPNPWEMKPEERERTGVQLPPLPPLSTTRSTRTSRNKY